MGRDKPHPAGVKRAASVKKKSKLVVTFDAEKRKEYLTGFSKRKQERRRFGLDMEAFKQKKKLLEARKQRREEQKQLYASLNIDKKEEEEDEVEEEEGDDSDDGGLQKETNVMTFDDEHTQSKFGDVVTVTTSVAGFKSDSDDEDEYGDLDEEGEEQADTATKAHSDKRKNGDSKEKQLSLFQRIQLKRKGLALPTKRSKLKMVRESRKGLAAAGKQLGRKGGPKRDDDGGDRKSGKAASVGKAKIKGNGKGMKKQVNKRRKH